MNSFTGVTITVVEAYTVVGRNSAGIEQRVTDTNAVTKGSHMWVTKKLYESIIRESS
jgi:hypothetical protein